MRMTPETILGAAPSCTNDACTIVYGHTEATASSGPVRLISPDAHRSRRACALAVSERTRASTPWNRRRRFRHDQVGPTRLGAGRRM